MIYNYFYIYKTTNLVSGKIYVGQRCSLKKCEEDEYIGSGTKLKDSIKKYGKEKFKKEIIEYTTIDLMDEREIFWIKELDAMNPKVGYNLCEGGCSTRGHVLSEEVRKRLSEKHKGKKLSEECKKKIGIKSSGNKYALGKKLTEEHKAKLGQIAKTRIRSVEERKKLSDFNKGNKNCLGRKLSEESKRKIGDGNRGKKRTKEERELMSARYKGRKATEETKQKMREARERQPILTCPHCGKQSKNKGNLTQNHFDNCKHKPTN